MAKVKVPTYDVSAAIEHVIGESEVGVKLNQLDGDYQALVTEVVSGDGFEGTLLYIPGISFTQLKVKRAT